MPARYSTQPHWRQRRHAIGRKAGFESEMLFESEVLVTKSKPDITPGSPVTVASMFDMPEIKPIVLPGAWTTVGKGGRPVRGEQKMYDEPKKKRKKNRRKKTGEEDSPMKRNRRPKQADQDDGSMADYEEMPSSSSCLITLSRSMLKHEKVVERKHQSKHWAKFREEKVIKALARDELVATLAAEGALGDDDAESFTSRGYHGDKALKKWQLNSRNNRAERVRRKVRLAAAAARCYFEPDDDLPTEAEQTQAATKSPLGSPSTKSTKKSTAGSAQPADILEGAEPGLEGPREEKGKKGRRTKRDCCVM